MRVTPRLLLPENAMHEIINESVPIFAPIDKWSPARTSDFPIRMASISRNQLQVTTILSIRLVFDYGIIKRRTFLPPCWFFSTYGSLPHFTN
jgi:hypothetical protein